MQACRVAGSACAALSEARGELGPLHAVLLTTVQEGLAGSRGMVAVTTLALLFWLLVVAMLVVEGWWLCSEEEARRRHGAKTEA